MKKQIEQLKAAVEAARQDKEAAELRYDEALKAVFEAERSARRKKKPTAAMLSLLRELNNGATIRRQKYYPYRHVVVGSSDPRRVVPPSVLNGLFEREALVRISEDATRLEFGISEHGKAFLSSPLDIEAVSV